MENTLNTFALIGITPHNLPLLTVNIGSTLFTHKQSKSNLNNAICMIYKQKAADVGIQQVFFTLGALACLKQHGEVWQRGSQNTQALIRVLHTWTVDTMKNMSVNGSMSSSSQYMVVRVAEDAGSIHSYVT